MKNAIVCVTVGAETCLRSLINFFKQDIPVDVLLIDNASKMEADNWQGSFEEELEGEIGEGNSFEVIRFNKRQSVALCWNFGIRRAMASSDHVLVVNDDILLRTDTYRLLLSTAEDFVTPVNVAKTIESEPGFDGDPDGIEQALSTLKVDIVDRSPHPDFSCFLIKKALWKEVGEFDTSFHGAYVEDCDYHCRIHLAGLEAWSVVIPYYHQASTSLKTADPSEQRKVRDQADRNRDYFENKYGFKVGTPEYAAFFNAPPPPKSKGSKKLLWVGDIECPTGFARVSESVLPAFREAGWDVHVLGINYLGDPHDLPYRIYPAAQYGSQDMWGFSRYAKLIAKIAPQAVLINNDPWVVAQFAQANSGVPTYVYTPIDALNVRRAWAEPLSGISRTICYTKFGEEVLRAGGFQGQASVIPHGVDLSLFPPIGRDDARLRLGLGSLKEKYIVGCVATNQFRKRLDLTIRYFYRWVSEYKVEDAYLYVHTKTHGLWDLKQLAEYYEGSLNITPARLILLGENIMKLGGVVDSKLHYVYNSFDVQMSTCGGEGWGLTHMEGMACKTPQILPGFGSLKEWASEGAYMVPCVETAATEYNTILSFPSEGDFIEALQELYEDKKLREKIGGAGYNLVSRPRFRWENIGRRFVNLLS